MTEALAEVKGKTLQRVEQVVAYLKENAVDEGVTYKDIQDATDVAYDTLTFIMATMVQLGCVSRFDDSRGSPGRPTGIFRWLGFSHL